MLDSSQCIILSGGPSTRFNWPPKENFDHANMPTVIAVNEAGMWYQHDWFVAWDTKPALRRFRPCPRVGIACWPRWSRMYPNVMPHLERFLLPDEPKHSRNFTLSRVAALVAHLGFKEATLYGCEWRGLSGVTPGNKWHSRRDPTRWADERRVVEDYCRHFGVVFQRWTPDGFEAVGAPVACADDETAVP